ncbi:response regulator transcription factor [Kineosporia babensis]
MTFAPGPSPTQKTLQPLRFAVLATDRLDEAAVGNLLENQPGFRNQPLNRLAHADVLVVVAPALTGVVLRRIRTITEGRSIPVAAVLDHVGDADLLAGVEAGLRGVLWRKQTNAARLATLLLSVSSGESDLPTVMQSRLLQELADLQRSVLAPRGITASGLEAREVQVLALMADGLGTSEIAERITYSERTVKNIISGLLTRWNLRNRTQAVAYALRSGIL